MSTATPRSTDKARAKKPRQVMVVDDHPVMRRALRDMLADESDLEVCAEAEDATSALQQLKRLKPDAVVVDLTLQESHGLELVKQIRTMASSIRVLVYSMHDENLYAERAIHAGANGYLTKTAPSEELIKALRTVLGNHMYLSPEMMSRMLHTRRGGARKNGESPLASLSDRELQVFEQLGRGANTHQIAEHMNVSTKTVDVYRQRIKSKLHITENNELIRVAVEESLGAGQ